jgi:hypothetical protein
VQRIVQQRRGGNANGYGEQRLDVRRLVGRRVQWDGYVRGSAERSYDSDGDLYDSGGDNLSAHGANERDGHGDGDEQSGGDQLREHVQRDVQ